MDTTRQPADDPINAPNRRVLWKRTIKTHAITVAEFDRMVDAGVYGPEDRIELIDGQLIDVPPQGAPHFGNARPL